MEYVYATMLLHSAGKDINEENVKGVLSASGIEADDARVKALVASLEGVDIEEAIQKAAVAPAAAAPAAPAGEEAPAEEAEEEEEEEEEPSEEEAMEGLGSLFG